MSNADAARALARGGGGGGWLSPFQWISLGVGLVGIISLVVAIFIITRESGNVAGFYAPGSDCSVVTCVGEKGDKGEKGESGEPGGDGKPGTDGRDGRDGQDGGQGPAGLCLNDNPACMQGEKGEKGDTGDTGARGERGYRGLTGLPGQDGRDGINGTNGVNGLNGTQGLQGEQGIPGNCSCLDLGDATYNTVNVTSQLSIPSGSTLALGGELNCDGGGTLSSSCFGLAACPNLTYCNVRVTSLDALDLVVGHEGFHVDFNNLSFTSYSPFISTIRLGSSADFPENRHNRIDLYATTTIVDGYGSTYVRALNGQLYLQTGGASTSNHIYLTSTSAQIIGNAAKGVVWTTTSGQIALNAASSSLVLNTGGPAQLTATTLTANSLALNLIDSVNTRTWMQGIGGSSYVCPFSEPGPMTSTPSGAHDLIGVDLVLAANRKFMSLATSGLISSTGFDLFCNAIIKTTSGSPLQLTSNPTDILDVRGIISNGGSSAPLRINDAEGLDLQDTGLFNSIGAGVTVSDGTGLKVNDGNTFSQSVLYTNFIEPVNTNITITSSVVTIIGDLDVQGSVTASGSCCPSDVRVKENVREVPPQDDLEAVMNRMPRRVSFTYKPDYAKTNRHLQHPEETYEGFIAQEMEAHGFPTLVSTRPQQRLADGTILQDFKGLNYELAVPYLIGAIRALREEQLHLRAEIERLGSSFLHPGPAGVEK